MAQSEKARTVRRMGNRQRMVEKMDLILCLATGAFPGCRYNEIGPRYGVATRKSWFFGVNDDSVAEITVSMS